MEMRSPRGHSYGNGIFIYIPLHVKKLLLLMNLTYHML